MFFSMGCGIFCHRVIVDRLFRAEEEYHRAWFLVQFSGGVSYLLYVPYPLSPKVVYGV